MTHFVAMMGTSGTFVGTSRRLKELNPAIKCISLQPDSPFHGIEGAKHMESAIVPKIYDPRLRMRIWGSARRTHTKWRSVGAGRGIAGRDFRWSCGDRMFTSCSAIEER